MGVTFMIGYLLLAFSDTWCQILLKQNRNVESIASAQTRSGGFSTIKGWLVNQASLAGKFVSDRVSCQFVPEKKITNLPMI